MATNIDRRRSAARAAGRPVLQNFTVVAGAAATTNIAITGIVREDLIVSVLRLDLDATAANINLTDVTSEVSVTSDGNIQLTTTNTTGDKLLVIWNKLRV